MGVFKITYQSKYKDIFCEECKEPFFPVEYGEECPKCGVLSHDSLHDIVNETITAALYHRDGDSDYPGEKGCILPQSYLLNNLANRYIYRGLLALNRFEEGNDLEEFAKESLSGLPVNKKYLENHLVSFIVAVLNRREEVKPFKRRVRKPLALQT